MLETRDIFNVELLSVGTWHGTGCPPDGCAFTTDDLDEIVSAFHKTKDVLQIPAKLGHDDQQKLLQTDGYPSAGWLENLRRDGQRLLADVRRVPAKLAELIEAGAYRSRSVELEGNYKVGDATYPVILTGMAWLGADLPAVQGLADIAGFYKAQQLALTDTARAVAFTAAPPEQTPERVLMTYADNAEKVLTDLTAFIARTGELAALRAKDGRKLSEKHVERLTALRDGLSKVQTSLGEWLKEDPPADPPSPNYGPVMAARARLASFRTEEIGAH